MMSDAEDANETLLYIQDIFQSGDLNINRMLANALLHYAYLPALVRSLCTISSSRSSQPTVSLSLNTCLYVLIQTFRLIKD